MEDGKELIPSDFSLQDIPPELRTPEEAEQLANEAATFNDDTAFEGWLRAQMRADAQDPADEPGPEALSGLFSRVREEQRAASGTSAPATTRAENVVGSVIHPEKVDSTPTSSPVLPSRRPSLVKTGAPTSASAPPQVVAMGGPQRSWRSLGAVAGGLLAACLAFFMLRQPTLPSDDATEDPVRTRGSTQGSTETAGASIDIQAALEHPDGRVTPFQSTGTLQRDEGLLFRFHVTVPNPGGRLLLFERSPRGTLQKIYEAPVSGTHEAGVLGRTTETPVPVQVDIQDATGKPLRYSPDGSAGLYHYVAVLCPMTQRSVSEDAPEAHEHQPNELQAHELQAHELRAITSALTGTLEKVLGPPAHGHSQTAVPLDGFPSSLSVPELQQNLRMDVFVVDFRPDSTNGAQQEGLPR